MSGPIVDHWILDLISAILAGEEDIAAIPAPANVTLDVEQNWYTISGLPAFSHSSRIFNTFACFSSSSNKWCTQYALSQ